MRALLLRQGGGVRLAEVRDAGEPRHGEIRVAMRLTPVNPADHLALEGRHLTDEYVQIPMGAEGVGVVEAVGDGVEGLQVGDRVLPLDRGNWADQRTVSAERVIRAPDALTDEQAAIFRINPPTAHRLLARADLKEGDWIVQNAAASMVGRLVAALGKMRGYRVISVVRSPEKDTDRLMRLGARAVIADGEGMAEAALALMGGPKARLALDFVTGTATGELARCVAPGGRVTVAGHLGKEPCSIPSTLLTAGNIIIDGYSVRAGEGTAGRGELQAMYDALAPLYTEVPEVLPELVRYPIADYERAVAFRGSQRPLLDWTAR